MNECGWVGGLDHDGHTKFYPRQLDSARCPEHNAVSVESILYIYSFENDFFKNLQVHVML